MVIYGIYGCFTENGVKAQYRPNGFADHEIPFLNGYLFGNIPQIFRQTHMERNGEKILGDKSGDATLACVF